MYCSGGCTEENSKTNCNKCLTDIDGIQNSEGDYTCTGCKAGTIFVGTACVQIFQTGCHSLCAGGCIDGDGQNTKCLGCKSGARYISTQTGNIFKCECNTGYDLLSGGYCGYKTSCHLACNSECIEQNRNDKCISCISGITPTQNGDGTNTCICNSGYTWNKNKCEQILNQCNSLCAGGCTQTNDPNFCVACKNLPGIASVSNDDLKKCSCDTGFTYSNGLCMLIDKTLCGEYCDNCIEAQNNAKCASCKVRQDIIQGTPDSNGILECKYNPFVIDFDIVGTIINRCNGMTVKAIVLPQVINNFI